LTLQRFDKILRERKIPMGAKIRLLSPSVISRIAAGEVIARPSSAVKELVENSLDASATRIRIELEAGGKKLIRVIDDGSGMTKDDAIMCIERHATSKIGDESDLIDIHTLGFRGEALASLAAVSKMKILSRSKDEETGTVVEIEAGEIKSVQEAGLPVGTTIEARDLFFNLPARKAFLKSPQIELANCIETALQIGLIQVKVALKLIHRGRELLSLEPAGDLAERLSLIIGESRPEDFISLDSEQGGLKLSGYALSPKFRFPSSRHYYIYINNRFVRDRVLIHAINEAYHEFIPKDSYGALLINLEFGSGFVDVNVHPAKSEVRFARSGLVHEFVRNSLIQSLSISAKHELERSLGGTSDTRTLDESASSPYLTRIREAVESFEFKRLATQISSPTPAQPPLRLWRGERTEWQPPAYEAEVAVLGQIADTYIVCKKGDSLILIDQHAADERIQYERVRRIVGKRPAGQGLLFSKVVELSPTAVATLEANTELLARHGIEFEPFGQNSIIVRTLPINVRDDEIEPLLTELSDELSSSGSKQSLDEISEKVIKLLACKSAIKAGERLSVERMQKLIGDLFDLENPSSCAHGRPTFVEIDEKMIEKLFLRR